MPARFAVDGQPFCALINRSRYNTDDLVELLARSIRLGLDRRWERVKYCLNGHDLWRYLTIVVEDYFGTITNTMTAFSVRDHVADVEEIMESKRGGRGLHMRVVRHERDRFHQNIVERIGTIEDPAASDAFRAGIADKFNFIVSGIGQGREVGDEVALGLRLRVMPEPAQDDLGILANAQALRYQASFEHNWSGRVSGTMATMLNQLRLADRRCVARGGEPGAVERQVRDMDPRLAFWLDVAQRWAVFEKDHPDPRLQKTFRIEVAPPERDTVTARVTVERL